MINKASIPNWDFDLGAKSTLWRQRNKFYENIHSNDVRYILSKVQAEVNMGLQLQVRKRAYSQVMNFRSNVCTVKNKAKLSKNANRHPSRRRAFQSSFPTEWQAFVGERETITFTQIFALLISIRTKHD